MLVIGISFYALGFSMGLGFQQVLLGKPEPQPGVAGTTAGLAGHGMPALARGEH